MFCQKEDIVKEKSIISPKFERKTSKNQFNVCPQGFVDFCFKQTKKYIPYHDKKNKVANNFAQNCNKFPKKTVDS